MNGLSCRMSVPACLLLIGLAVCAPGGNAQAGPGQWRTLPYTMPINPVHTALLYNGKVLIVSGSGNVAGNSNYQAALWDPQAGTITTQPVTWDMFCNGMVVLPDGRPFVMGGTLQYDPFHGELKTATYNPATNTFTNQQSMAHGRWYPTGTVLGDGRTMIFSGLSETGGTNSTVEFYSAGSGWSAAFSAPWTPPLYPRMHLLPNGNVFYSGATTGSSIFNPSTHTWTVNVAFTNYSGTRTYGTSVLFPLTPANNYTPKVIIMGGGNPSTNTTETIDLSAATPKWANGPNMSQPRIEMNATLLPSGKILALGGSLNDEDTNTASLNADLYDPATNTFSSAGALVYARLYHSVSLLMPDATVWVAGGNPARGTYESHMEVYTPQYLLNADGTPATRPTISGTSSAAMGYATAFQVRTPDAASISNVVLMRNGAVTHAFDMDQRYVGLSFTSGAGVLNVTGPPNSNIAPPGYYMLFILNNAGVPSVAAMVQVSQAANDEPPTGTITNPVSNPTTITAGQSVTYSGTGTDPDGTISAYSWSFPGGNPSSSNLANPGSVTYATPGTYVTTFTVTDNAGLTDPNPPTRTITVQGPPAITSPNNATLTVGTAGSFTVTTTGSPTPTLGETGTLPSGVTFVNNGNGTATLSGTPAAGSGGTYLLTLTASNGVGTAASQSFTLTVSTGGGGSSNFAYVADSVSGVYNASQATGTALSVPLHQIPGVGNLLVCAATWQSSTATATISDPNNGTWTAIGAAKAGVGSLTGYQGQMFYVPSAVSASTTVTLTISSAVAFRAFECAEYSYTGTMATLDGAPQYSTTASAGGVATVSGVTTTNGSDLVFADCLGVDTTCAAGTGYTGLNDVNTFDAGAGKFGANFWGLTGQLIEYKAGVAGGAQSATFGTGTATDNVILGLVAFTAPPSQAAPAITSGNATTFIVGTAGSFTVTTTGAPTPALTETGALPSGVTFKDNGNGTGTLSGTPASGSVGSYPVTLSASNGVGSPASQSFTLTVNQVAAITSANNTTFAAGAAGSFTITTTGTPTPTLKETGALPSGVTFVDNGNGTGTLSGTPATGSGGTYNLTITASNGAGTAASQTFTLKVNQAPVITSANTTTFTVGTAGSFAVTTTGSPTPTVGETGTLPSGVTFKDNGNGTATLSGTPGSGSNGNYALTITASNGVGSAAGQSFTLTVNTSQAAPVITSANNTTFTVGTAGSFALTTTGSPTPTLGETGALPSGVTFVNNGNGTATLSGTPAAGSGGTYGLTVTASNGVGTAASQSFTLTVNGGGGGGGGSSNFAYVAGSVSGVYNASQSTGTTLFVPLHQVPGGGHLLVCAATWQSSTATATMSDPNNGTWATIGVGKAGVGSLSGYRGQMFYVPSAVSASTTVTLTISSAVAFRAFECAEYSYTGTMATLDGAPQYSTTASAGGVATVSGVTTTNGSDLVFADCLGVDTTCAAGAGYTGLNDANTFDAGGGKFGANFWGLTGQLIEYKVGVAAGTQSATFGTGTASENVILGLVGF